MADTERSLSQLQSLLADNVTGDISPQDIRDFLVSVYPQAGPEILVASADAATMVKNRADYVCDGTADDVQIQAALDALGANGGTVKLSYGTYIIASEITMSVANTCLVGEGRIATSLQGGGTNSFLNISAVDITLRDLQVWGYGNMSATLVTASAKYLVLDRVVLLNAGTGLAIGATQCTLFNSAITNCTTGIYASSDANFLRVFGCDLYTNVNDGVLVNLFLADTAALIGTNLEADGDATGTIGVYIDAYNSYALFLGSRFETLATGIEWNTGDGQYDRIIGCHFADDVTTPISNPPANALFARNSGFVTENSGTATLVNGQTSIAVNHGLDVTPAVGDILVTPIEAWGSMTQFYIDTYTSTQFTIHADQDPGQDVDFAWKAVYL